MSTPATTARAPHLAGRVRYLLVQDDNGNVWEVEPAPGEHTAIEVRTPDPRCYRERDGYFPCATPEEREPVPTFLSVSVNLDPGHKYTVHPHAAAVLMKHDGFLYNLSGPSVQESDATDEPEVAPDAVTLGVPYRAQPALAYVNRAPGSEESGTWFLGEGPSSVPPGRKDRNLLRALLETVLADLDDAERPRVTADDLVDGSINGLVVDGSTTARHGFIVDGYLTNRQPAR